MKHDHRWIFNWFIDEAIPDLLDPNALLRNQTFRSDQDHQLAEVAESSIHSINSRYMETQQTRFVRLEQGKFQWFMITSLINHVNDVS